MSGYRLDPLQVRLVSGDVADASSIHWSASSSADWIRLELPGGTVSSLSAAAALPFAVDLRGLNDTALSGPLTANITIQSNSSYGEMRFLDGSETMRIPVELEIEAEACANTSNVTLAAVAAGQTISSGFQVVEGDSVRVTVSSYDADGLPIERPTQQIDVTYRAAEDHQNSSRAIVMKWTGQNQFVGEIDGKALLQGQYALLLVESNKAEKSEDFTVATKSSLELIFGICAMVLLGGMLAAFLILVYKNQSRAKAVAMSFLKLEMRSGVELLVDSWDAAGMGCTLLSRLSASDPSVWSAPVLRACIRRRHRAFHVGACIAPSPVGGSAAHSVYHMLRHRHARILRLPHEQERASHAAGSLGLS